MAVIPLQQRHVDPYEPIITSNAVNTQFRWIQGPKGIIEGLTLEQTETRSFTVHSGLGVVDGCVIKFPEDTLVNLSQTSFTSGTENVVFVKYKYELVQPVPEAIIDVQDTNSFTEDDTTLILGFADINSDGVIVSIYENSAVTNLARDNNPIDQMISEQILATPEPIQPNSDLNLVGHFITNISDPTSDLDAVNKGWTDTYINQHANDRLVKVDENEASSDHYPEEFTVNKGWFLNEEIVCDNDVVTKQVIVNSGYKQIKLNKTNYRCKVISGDSVLT